MEASEEKPASKKTAANRLEGQVFPLVAEQGSECVLAPADGKAFEEWRRLTELGDDVGVAMMIADKRLLLLAPGHTIRMLGTDGNTGWCEVRILEGEHFGKTALISRSSFDPKANQKDKG